MSVWHCVEYVVWGLRDFTLGVTNALMTSLVIVILWLEHIEIRQVNKSLAKDALFHFHLDFFVAFAKVSFYFQVFSPPPDESDQRFREVDNVLKIARAALQWLLLFCLVC